MHFKSGFVEDLAWKAQNRSLLTDLSAWLILPKFLYHKAQTLCLYSAFTVFVFKSMFVSMIVIKHVIIIIIIVVVVVVVVVVLFYNIIIS